MNPVPRMTKAEFDAAIASGKKYVIFRGGVYDVAGCIDSHPAGKAVVERAIGTDMTMSFNNMHSVKTRQNFLKLKVAVLIP